MQSKLRKAGAQSRIVAMTESVLSRCGCYLNMEPMRSTQIMDGHTGRIFPTYQGLSCRQLLHTYYTPPRGSLGPSAWSTFLWVSPWLSPLG